MSLNGIARLATRELRQKAKLDLAKQKRQDTGTNGYRENNAYDLSLLPTQYDDDTVVDNPNVGGLQQARPWKPGV